MSVKWEVLHCCRKIVHQRCPVRRRRMCVPADEMATREALLTPLLHHMYSQKIQTWLSLDHTSEPKHLCLSGFNLVLSDFMHSIIKHTEKRCLSHKKKTFCCCLEPRLKSTTFKVFTICLKPHCSENRSQNTHFRRFEGDVRGF